MGKTAQRIDADRQRRIKDIFSLWRPRGRSFSAGKFAGILEQGAHGIFL